jgi:hypothetical protein
MHITVTVTAVVWKEYPQSGIDYWMIAIFDKDEQK